MTTYLLHFKVAVGFTIYVALFTLSANLYAATQSTQNTSEHNFQGYYDEPTAISLSVMPTVVGLTGGILLTAIKPTPARAITGLSLAALSLTVFPSLGYFYIHEHSTGIKKMLIRTALYSGSMLFLFTIDNGELAAYLSAGCLIAAVVMTIYDFIDLKNHTRILNEEIRHRNMQISFAPLIVKESRQTAYGGALNISF